MEGAYGDINSELREKMQQMYSMNERLVHLINNILNMSRIEKNRLEYHYGYVDVSPMIKEVIDELVFKAQEKKIKLAVKKMPELPAVYTDSDKLHEIITNLVDNAIKYSHKGTVRVSAEVGEEGKEVIIMVKDDGIGMTADEMKHLFEKFYRANAPGAPKETGTGLGLYICARFVQNMGGRIWVAETISGKGTTMAVALPTRPVDAQVESMKS
jgi:signal transduction histidine kinase